MGAVQGAGSVQRRIQDMRRKQTDQFKKRLLKAGLFVQRESQKIVPVDTGALKASARTRLEQDGKDRWYVIIAYFKHYAIYVHERLDVYHPVGEAKFLTRAINRNRHKIAAILRGE